MALTKQISSRALVLSSTTAEVTTAQTIAPYYDFRVDGVLDIDIEESLDASRYIHASQSFISAKVSVRVGGTSEYDLTVKSYDSTGGDEVTHIDVTNQQFPSNNSITTLGFVDANISAERTLVFSIVESTSAVPVEDFCLTIVSSTFADLDLLDSGGTASSLSGPPLTNSGGSTLLEGRVLAITPTGIDYASADDAASARAAIGVATSDAAPTEAIELNAAGYAPNILSGLGFSAGDEVYLGLNGNLVDSATASGFPPGHTIKQIGFAVNSSDLWVQIADAEIII